LYEIMEPNEVVPQFIMGPFKGWQKHYPEEENQHTFADLVHDQPEWVLKNAGIKARRADFPQPTQFIGVYIEETKQIVLYEGHHRSAAVALAVSEGKPIDFNQNPTIAITSMGPDEAEQLKKTVQNNSANPAKK